MNFFIMNKDIQVLEFSITNVVKINSISVVSVFNKSLIPLPLRRSSSLSDWLRNRLILTHRSNINKLFSRLGIVSLQDKILYTHCISLLDTYWVRGNDERINWSSVSPYCNPFNELVARYAINSSNVFGKNIGHSPDFSTGGSFPKCWRRVNGSIYLYKGGSTGASNSGNEPYFEVLASSLAEYLMFNSIHYELCSYKGVITSRCLNMCSEKIGLYTVEEIFPEVNSYIELFRLLSNKNDIMLLLQILLLDYLTLNVDRHLSNISFFVNNDTQELGDISLIYDNNLSLLPYYIEQLDGSILSYIQRNSSTYAYTKLGISFTDLLNLLCSINRQYVLFILKKAQGFSYYENVNRGRIANEILQIQLNNAKQILKII